MRSVAGVTLLAVAGCAFTAPSTLPPGSPTAGPWTMTQGRSFPGAAALAEELYGSETPPSEIDAKIHAALQQFPDDPVLHEMAAYSAILAADQHEAWFHFMKAAADRDSALGELYLWELTAEQTRSESDATALLYEEIREHHPRSAMRALATDQLARQRRRVGEPAEARTLSRTLGFIENWAILGPFPNDQGKGFITAYPPENKSDSAADRAAMQQGPLVPIGWRTIDRANDVGAVVLEDLFAPHESGVGYLVTYVHSDENRKATLRLTTADPTRIWWNDGLVLSEELLSGGDFDTVVVAVDLSRGWNKILIKSAHRNGGWALKARITDENGAPIASLRYDAAPHEHPSEGSTPSPLAPLPPQLSLPEGARGRFLRSRFLMRGGWERKALEALQEQAATAPRNRLTLYFGALAFWDNDELGKAIDLLNQGVSDGKCPAFLRKRAAYYLQKRLYEKAQQDLLAAIAVAPQSRFVEMELAELFGHRGWLIDRCKRLAIAAGKWPDDAWVMREYGVCLRQQGYDERAWRMLARARELEPGSVPTIRAQLEIELNHLDPHARATLDLLREMQPTRAEFVVDEAELSRRAGDIATATALLQEAARLAPEWGRPLRGLGDLAHEAGRDAEALPLWKAALARDPNDNTLAQRIDFLEPTRLGFIEKLVPGEDAIDRAANLRVAPLPGAQVIMLLDDEVTEVNADGSARRVVTRVMQAVNEQGRDALIHERVPSGSATKMLHAYSLSRSGEMQEASSIRGDEVRFRNLEVGSRIVLQYVHYEPAPKFLPGQYVAGWYFQSVGRQHESSRWVVVLDKGRTFNVEVSGDISRDDSIEGDHQLHVFSARHVPPIVAEPSMPPPADLLRRVTVSTVENWEDYVRWERALIADAFHTNPKLDELVARLTADAPTPREKLDRLFHYATQDIRYQQDYENTIAGVRPHASPIVLERGYGDCKDKAVLLIQMARLAHLKLEFALLRTTRYGKLLRRIPNQQFNHAIVHVPAQSGIEAPFFMDPTSDGLDMGNLRGDDQGAVSLVLDPESGASNFIDIPYQSPDLQYEQHAIRVTVKSPTEAQATVDLTLRGGPAMRARHLLRDRGAAQKWLESAAPALFSGSTLVNSSTENEADILQPVTLHLQIDASNSIQARDDRWQLPMPGSFLLDRLVSLPRRETPLQLDVPDTHRYRVETELPEGFEATHVPAEFSVEHACFTAKRTAKAVGRIVTVVTEYQRRCTVVAPADYPAFRDAVQRVVRQFSDEIVFQKQAAPVPPATKGRKTRPGGP
jgi:tetratricopeptide (TPR) repeat protein